MIVLVQCTKSKRNEPAKAKNLYDTSVYFTLMREYAQAKGEDWFILSAKHGLVNPDAKIEPYDEIGITKIQAKEIANVIANKTYVVEIIAGKQYTKHLIPALENNGVTVVNNFAGLEIGQRMAKLKRETRKLTHKQL